MRNRTTTNTLLAAMSFAALLAACAENNLAAPEAAMRPLAPSGGISANVIGTTLATVQVCAEGVAGSYGYSLGYTIAPTSTDVVATPAGSSFALTAGQCKVVLTVSPGTPASNPDAGVTVTVTQLSAPANTSLSYVQRTQLITQAACSPIDLFPCGVDVKDAGPASTTTLNLYHGSVLSFWNSALPAVRGCTYTQGWYKNHTNSWPTGFSPNAAFYTSGSSYINLYNTPPKGSQYIILAHQFMTAQMNIASGASVPTAVQNAFDASKAYFVAGGVGNISGLSTILDTYNNGLAAGGPPHCD